MPFGKQQITIPEGFPENAKTCLAHFKDRIPADLSAATQSIRKECENSTPTMAIRPNLKLFMLKKDDDVCSYSFCGSDLVGLGNVSSDGESWGVMIRLDRSLIECHEIDKVASRTIEFHQNGFVKAFTSGPRFPTIDPKSVVRINWTSDGKVTEPESMRIPKNGDSQSFSTFLALRRSTSELMRGLGYYDEPSKQLLAGFMVKTDVFIGGYYWVFFPSRRRFEISLALGDDFLTLLERSSNAWTDFTLDNAYCLGRLLAFSMGNAAATLSERLAKSEDEKVKLLGFAGLSGRGRLKDDTQTQSALLKALHDYAEKPSLPDLKPSENNMRARRAEMAALILGVCGNAQIAEEAMAQLSGDARKLNHAGALCEALGDVKCSKAVPLLLKLMVDNDFRYPNCALRILMRLGEKESFPLAVKRLETLKTTLDEVHLPIMCDLAAELEALTGEVYYDDFAGWKTWWEANKTTWVVPTCPEDIGR